MEVNQKADFPQQVVEPRTKVGEEGNREALIDDELGLEKLM